MLDALPSTARLVDVRTGQHFDYLALSALTRARAEVFGAVGVGRHDLVGICHRHAAILLIDVFACWQIGAAPLILGPTLTAAERKRIVEWARPACWVGDKEPPGVKALAPELMEPRYASIAAPSVGELRLDDRALVLLTSGTTGRPKGVSISHRALRARLASNVKWTGREDMARSLVPLPLHFGHGLIGNALTPLISGGTVLLWPEPGVEGLAQLGSLIDEHQITFLSSVPSIWRVALKVAAPPQRGTLRRLHVGSEQLSVDLWRGVCEWAQTRQVFNMYGITEAANWVSGASAEESGCETGAVGRPWSGTLRVEREDGTLVECGQGEILLSDPALMTGYLNDEAATNAVMVGSWLKTGDIGEIDSQGRLRIIGRAKHQINRGGIKISAEEIDLLLEQHPDVEEACTFALPDPVSGEIVAAAIVPRRGSLLQPAALKAWCAERVRIEAIPARIVILDALPRSERGKILREEVRRMASDNVGVRG